MFSGLEIIAGCINLFKSLIGLSPNCDLDGFYLKSKMEKVHNNTVMRTSKQREVAQDEYRQRVQEITSR